MLLAHLYAVPWWTRRVGTALIRALPLPQVALVGAALWAVHAGAPAAEPRQWGVLLSSVAGVAAGCAALAWVRPQRAGLSPPHAMLSLGFGGMLAGLLLDMAQTGPARLGAMCSQSSVLDLWQSLGLHLMFLPWMHLGMGVGGLLAIPSLRILRSHCSQYLCSLFVQNALCSSWMLLGMTAGAVGFGRWQWLGAACTLSGMLGGMFVGMTWGMVTSVALYRRFFKWRNRC